MKKKRREKSTNIRISTIFISKCLNSKPFIIWTFTWIAFNFTAIRFAPFVFTLTFQIATVKRVGVALFVLKLNIFFIIFIYIFCYWIFFDEQVCDIFSKNQFVIVFCINCGTFFFETLIFVSDCQHSYDVR